MCRPWRGTEKKRRRKPVQPARLSATNGNRRCDLGFDHRDPVYLYLAQPSQLAEKSEWDQGSPPESLHYARAVTARTGCATGAVMRGGGWGGRSSFSCLTRSFCSAFSSVWRVRIRVRPSVVGKCTSSIWMAENLSSAARG